MSVIVVEDRLRAVRLVKPAKGLMSVIVVEDRLRAVRLVKPANG